MDEILRRSREGGNPVSFVERRWIPAFAGTTEQGKNAVMKSGNVNKKPIYRLAFENAALAEWNRLDGSIKEILRKLLKKRLVSPHAKGAELHGELSQCYKIKLRKQGYRLISCDLGATLAALMAAVQAAGDRLVTLTTREPTLEDAFVALTGHGLRDETT